ncbi:hypothetical protein PsorP6_001779 [Peronosclerospora sorghi]|uniref:Uncharacterized protein n=1 Tax=Peronosclerospora sorghi TaxID=230839 RepID=A0ACC0WPL4_9STRA|nr:hypothetical protein PsorP6_001779 [Peronosclerospora sorghi]
MNCDTDVSKSVYIFTLMFDVLSVSRGCPQLGSFRNKLVAHLWDSTLNKFPYREIPALAFCHILGSILLWNSATDRQSLTNPKIYTTAIDHALSKVCVKGQPVHGSTVDSNTIRLADLSCNPIELLDLDNKFASMLRLDAFFEVMKVIQNNRLKAASGQASCT